MAESRVLAPTGASAANPQLVPPSASGLEAARGQLRVKAALEAAASRGFPEWIEVDAKAGKGVFKAYPQRAELPPTINEGLVVELYSR